MSNTLMAFLVTLGCSAWVYSKLYRRTGGNNQSSLLVTGLIGVLLFVVVLIVLNTLLH